MHPKNSHQGPGAAQLILCPPGTPSSVPTTRDAHKALEGTRGGSSCCPGGPNTWCKPGESPDWQRVTAASQKSAGVGRMGKCQLFRPPTPLLPPSCPGEGLALLGHPRTQPGCPLLGRDGPGLPNPLLPSRKGGSGSHGGSHKAPAQLRPQTHHTRAGGEVTRGRVQHPPSGAPSRDGLRTPLQTRAGAGRERGRIPALGGCSQRLFLCRKRQNSLGSGPGPSAGNKGAGQGLGDMGTCPRAQCLIDFQHYPGRG